MSVNRNEAQQLFDDEQTARVAGDAVAGARAFMLRRYVPADGVLEVPDRWLVLSHEFYDLDENAEIVLSANAAMEFI